MKNYSTFIDVLLNKDYSIICIASLTEGQFNKLLELNNKDIDIKIKRIINKYIKNNILKTIYLNAFKLAYLAQMVEQLFCKHQVVSSILTIGSIF